MDFANDHSTNINTNVNNSNSSFLENNKTNLKSEKIEEVHSFLPSTTSASRAYVEPYIVWENGVPIKKTRLVLAKDDISEMKIHAATQVYHGDWDPVAQAYIPDPRYEGLSKIEVAQHKLMDKAAAGDTQALSQIEDRILGKPKQQVESLQINATLESFLEKVAKNEGLAQESDIIEGEVVGYSPSLGQEDNQRNKELDI